MKKRSKRKVERRKKPKQPKAHHAKKSEKRKLTAVDIQNVRTLADQLGKMIALSGYYESSFTLKTLAKDFGLSKLIPKKAANKKESFSVFIRSVLEQKPRTLKKLVREVMPRAIEKRFSQGDPILEQEAIDLVTQLDKLGVKMRKEILGMNFPKERPSVVPPPKAIVDMLKKFKLHPALMPECETMFAEGHLNESVRKALETFETSVQQISARTEIGFDLMMKAFDETAPLIKIMVDTDPSFKDHQAGFRFMTAGIMRCWRNPLSHGSAPQMPYHEAFGRLVHVSNMFRTLDARVP